MRWLLAMLALPLVACGGEEVAVPDGYPERPHGSEIGEVFSYFESQAYRVDEGQTALASTGDYRPITMLDVKAAGPSHVLLHLAAMW